MILYTVVPCYNEELVLRETYHQLKEKYNHLMTENLINDQSRIVFVNDGSKDKTWSMIQKLVQDDVYIKGINLSRNRGHQNALLAGLMTVKEEADAVISMDADLQDDINAMDEMIEKYKKGVDIVYGVRSSRKTDSFFKRVSAEAFYRLMHALGVSTVFNHADYRLMSKRALDGLASFEEVHLFLRGIVVMIGYSSDTVFYERKERFAGESKYPLKKMISFAVDGITSLSIKPIRMITFFGIFALFVSVGMIFYTLIAYFKGDVVSGWPSIMTSLWFLGGTQLLSIGIVGEYVGKNYIETKRRPRYIISDYIGDPHD
ncbi:glycosyltransferase [Erysipelothrix larvae]|uniref:Glycosyltransferase n=1 Tax=Erysipelothrix larvae TaxID=1514105 RepID=A0A120JTH4_9FIRM|nr:glycosyltransferase family 2 protein [Erysipelothrix larvae]AMC92882.1 glycosyltransferase [Erysipelothrix larvae]